MCHVESIFEALTNRRRRIALRCLQQHRTVALPDLAELVLEHETEADVADLPAERVRDVYFSLYHTHVPKLVDAGLAYYEQQQDVVGVTDRTGPVLARARETVDSLMGP